MCRFVIIEANIIAVGPHQDAGQAADRDTDNICNWNKTLTASKVLKRLNDNVGISHQVRSARLTVRVR